MANRDSPIFYSSIFLLQDFPACLQDKLNEKIYFSPLDDVHVGLGAAVSQAVQHLNQA